MSANVTVIPVTVTVIASLIIINIQTNILKGKIMYDYARILMYY